MDNTFNNFNEHSIQGGFNSDQSNGNFINEELHIEYRNDHNIPRQPNIEPRRTNEERQRVSETPTQPNVESNNGSQQPKN